MMLVFSLIVFLGGMTLFGGVEAVPSSGTGDVLQAPAGGKPQLAIKRVMPITIVAGSGFKSGEVVRLTGVHVRQVRASAKGTFTIRLRNMDPCSGFSITAVGSKGSRTSIQYSQLHCVDQ